ncbi:MAG: hypothetical protein IPL96_17585, partial [Holophagaceae bacterium]|nr:hypothetical protein [Holophagaceae bacterium]
MRPGPRHFLFSDEILRSGQWLTSANGRFYGLLGVDGRFRTCEGSGPTDPASREVLAFPAEAQPAGPHFMIMRADGDLAICRGTGPEDDRGRVWGLRQLLSTLPGKAGTQYQASLDDAGNLRVYDWNVDLEEGPYWSAAEPFGVEADTTVPRVLGVWWLQSNKRRPGPRGSLRVMFHPKATCAPELEGGPGGGAPPTGTGPCRPPSTCTAATPPARTACAAWKSKAPFLDVDEFRSRNIMTRYAFPAAPQYLGSGAYTLELVGPPRGSAPLLFGSTVKQGETMPDLFDNMLCFTT